MQLFAPGGAHDPWRNPNWQSGFHCIHHAMYLPDDNLEKASDAAHLVDLVLNWVARSTCLKSTHGIILCHDSIAGTRFRGSLQASRARARFVRFSSAGRTQFGAAMVGGVRFHSG